jgi:hypothetical protein
VKSRWAKADRRHSPAEAAGALAFIAWRIAGQTVLHLENEGFQTDTQRQRLDIMAELLAFLVHVTDRWLAEPFDHDQRQAFISQYARKLADYMHDNRVDFEGRGEDFRGPFIELLNARMADYADFSFSDGQPGYACKRYLGEQVTERMGEKDRKWVSDQVMEIEVPEMLKPLGKGFKDLTGDGQIDWTKTAD